MGLSGNKRVIFICSFLATVTFWFQYQSGFMSMQPKIRELPLSTEEKALKWKKCERLISGKKKMSRPSNLKNDSEILDSYKALKWKKCERLISGKKKMSRPSNLKNDSEILDSYKASDTCYHILNTRFAHPQVTTEEQRFPIAFGIAVYKNARLFERVLQAIYMPNNVYCIHIDKKSSEVFRKAIQAMIRCLPNVFISTKSADVVWGHFSIVQAQLNCMEELLESSVRWKYFINLGGQDFPLYENKEIVTALKSLNNSNSIESPTFLKKVDKKRTAFVYVFNKKGFRNTSLPKLPPPHNISIRKGSTFIAATRGFIEFLIHSKIVKDFLEFLKDTFIPDETLYASLQQHPLAPGGIRGGQQKWIARAVHWPESHECYGRWTREVCWISIEDLRWVLGQDMKEKLFVNKIPFKFNDDLLECILAARQGRKYGTAVWKQEEKKKQGEKATMKKRNEDGRSSKES